MLVQYSSKLLIWYLKKINQASPLAIQIANLAGPVSDFRILLRYYGLLPLIQWIKESEKNPNANPKLQLLGRLQNAANLIYYPLEHAYWLGLHQVIPMSPATRDKIGMWSCRFWATYVILYFAQLHEERKEYEATTVKLLKDGESTVAIEKKKKDWNLAFLINSAYFPLTVHWSLESSGFPDVGVGLFGTIAAVAQVYISWNATK